MTPAVAEVVARVTGMGTEPHPWPHSVCDDFLPADVFAELVAALPTLHWDRPEGQNRKAKQLPECVRELLLDPEVLGAIGARFGFGEARRVILEAAWFGPAGLVPHCDRDDKLWSGQVYLAGEPVGTHLFDAADKLARTVEWKENRLACWTRPPAREKHSAPKTSGRFVLLYWLMR